MSHFGPLIHYIQTSRHEDFVHDLACEAEMPDLACEAEMPDLACEAEMPDWHVRQRCLTGM